MDFLSAINLMFESADVRMPGFTVADVHAKLEGVTIETVKENVDHLVYEGWLYTTVDKDHFLGTQWGNLPMDALGIRLGSLFNTEEEPRAAGAAGITQAACAGDVEAVRRLLEAGADKEKATANGCTPLYIACEHGHIEVAWLLVEAGADKDKTTTNGYRYTPLLVACFENYIEAVQLLVEAGADKEKATTADGSTPLYVACENGHVEVARLLVEAGADKEKAAADGCTPLLIACIRGSLEVVQLLVETRRKQRPMETHRFLSHARWIILRLCGC
jgi:hypothetical protein